MTEQNLLETNTEDFLQDLIEHRPPQQMHPTVRIGLLRTLCDPHLSFYNLLLGYISPINSIFDTTLRDMQGLPGNEELHRSIVLNVIKNALDNYSIFSNLSYWHRDTARRSNRRSYRDPQGMSSDLTQSGRQKILIPNNIQTCLRDNHGWVQEHFEAIFRSATSWIWEENIHSFGPSSV